MTTSAINLLSQLIQTPSFSRDEAAAADIIEQFIASHHHTPHRHGNNVWALSPRWHDDRPTILLDAHIDTVRPTPRSLRLSSSATGTEHPILLRTQQLGLKPFGSPTLSNQALIPFPSIKIGPGQSARSHTADEFILVSEIKQAIELYTKLLQ